MKKIMMVLITATLMSHAAFAQMITADKVPAPVTTAFKAKFPAASAPTWKMKTGLYEASFKLNTSDVSANFDATGKWQETETALKTTSLPTSIQSALTKDFAGFKVNEASKVESAKTGSSYEAEIAKGTEYYAVTFAADGKMLSKTKVAEEKGEKG